MYTRDQYMEREVEHHVYFSQFVSNGVRIIVKNAIGIDAIMNSNDENFNDIPLKKWDAIVHLIQNCCRDKLRETKEGVSVAACVCIAKAAARMIREDLNKSIKNFTDEF